MSETESDPTAEPDAELDEEVEPADQVEDVEPEWVRRKRLAAVFGDVLPEQTGDDRDSGPKGGKGDDWYRDQVPPHHG